MKPDFTESLVVCIAAWGEPDNRYEGPSGLLAATWDYRTDRHAALSDRYITLEHSHRGSFLVASHDSVEEYWLLGGATWPGVARAKSATPPDAVAGATAWFAERGFAVPHPTTPTLAEAQVACAARWGAPDAAAEDGVEWGEASGRRVRLTSRGLFSLDRHVSSERDATEQALFRDLPLAGAIDRATPWIDALGSGVIHPESHHPAGTGTKSYHPSYLSR